MKMIYLCLSLILFAGLGQAQNVSVDKQKCESLIALAEVKQLDWVYQACGFDDEVDAWKNWAPFVSKNVHRKALYTLCQKYPEHEYSQLYCQKAADAGYVPAVYAVAQHKKAEGDAAGAVALLKKIVTDNDLSDKIFVVSDEDKTTVKAMQELGLAYLKGEGVAYDFAKAYTYLEKAAKLDSPEAAHALGAILFWEGGMDLDHLSQIYWWKAIAQGCAQAEETLGILDLYLNKKLGKEDAQQQIRERLGACDVKKTKTAVAQMPHCDCPAVMAWHQSQSDKPYIVIKINEGEAVLEDKNNIRYTYKKGELTSAGFYVQDVRPTAVILTKGAERQVLLIRMDAECVAICQDPQKVPVKYLDSLPPYQIQYTQAECEKIAEAVEMMADPSQRFKGLRECQLRDWATWGQWALDKQANKMLYLLGNYAKSNYIPAQMAEIERLFGSQNEADAIVMKNLFTYISAQTPSDKLSTLKKEQAFCIRAYTFMTEETKDDSLAFLWAQEGAELGYPHSMNMLGVLYARGQGVPKDARIAASWFDKAVDAAAVPYLEPKENLAILSTGKDFDTFKYGSCRQIIKPDAPAADAVLAFFP